MSTQNIFFRREIIEISSILVNIPSLSEAKMRTYEEFKAIYTYHRSTQLRSVVDSLYVPLNILW